MWHLAQVNIARLLEPLESATLQDFVDLLDPVNAAADRSPGFVWRLQKSEGNATAIPGFSFDVGDSPGVIVNMSVWEDIESCANFVFGPMHKMVLRRRREWFDRMSEPLAAAWWIPAGSIPTVAEAEERVLHLREHGPTPFAFSLQRSYPQPENDAQEPLLTRAEWFCEAG